MVDDAVRTIEFYKITKIVGALLLAGRCVYMRVCKHGCDVKIFCVALSNLASRKTPCYKQAVENFFPL